LLRATKLGLGVWDYLGGVLNEELHGVGDAHFGEELGAGEVEGGAAAGFTADGELSLISFSYLKIAKDLMSTQTDDLIVGVLSAWTILVLAQNLEGTTPHKVDPITLIPLLVYHLPRCEHLLRDNVRHQTQHMVSPLLQHVHHISGLVQKRIHVSYPLLLVLLCNTSITIVTCSVVGCYM
jgi:hypothetical protein